MGSTREIKRRIKSIKNIQQITKAMEMVAANRLRKAEARVVPARPYTQNMATILRHLAETSSEKNIFFNPEKEAGKILVILITSDKGLCGAYNTNIINHTVKFVKQHPQKDVKFYLLGKKGFMFLNSRKYNIEKYHTETVEQIGASSLQIVDNKLSEIAAKLIKDFEENVFDEIHLFYSKFKTVMKSIPSSLKLLPIAGDDASSEKHEEQKVIRDYILEPSSEVIASELLPKYVEAQLRQAVFESLTSEFAARRVAMIAASDNAEDIIDELTRTYNKARQEAITKELLEVVSGTEALAG